MFSASPQYSAAAAWLMRAKQALAGGVAAAALVMAMPAAHANGPEPFIGQLNAFAFSFGSGSECPWGWLAANGQLLQVRTNSTLFAILGTVYGGDGIQTFALPNLSGRVPVGAGQGAGVNAAVQPGESGGRSTVTLTQLELPPHSHMAVVQPQAASAATPGSGTALATGQNLGLYGPRDQGQAAPLAATMAAAGASTPVGLGSPSLTVQWCIAVQGVFPPRP